VIDSDTPLDPTVVDAAHSKGITDSMVSDPSLPGVTCFDLPFTPKGGEAVADYASLGTQGPTRVPTSHCLGRPVVEPQG
jgi:hypothetical protein